MSNENNISLSQEEVDRLLGQKESESDFNRVPKKTFKREIIAADSEISKFNEIMIKFSENFRIHLKNILSEQGIRKISPKETEQMSRLEFMSTVNKNDFLFFVEIENEKKNFELLLKFDSFLFCALSGISFSINHQTNLFQNEAIRTVVAPIAVKELLNAANKHNTKIKITPLFDLPMLEGLKTETAGICATYSWNEGFKSLGVEKIFFQKDFLDFLNS